MPDDTFIRSSRANLPFNRAAATPDPGARQPGTDPLSELARLIGHTDPFADSSLSRPERDLRDILSGRPSNDWPEDAAGGGEALHDTREIDRPFAPSPILSRGIPGGARPLTSAAAAPPVVPHYRDEEPREADADDAQYQAGTESEPGSAPYGHAPDYGQDQPEGPYYGDDGQLSDHDPYDQDASPEEAPPARRRGGLITVAAVLGLAILGTAGAYAYRTVFSMSAPAIPPLIKADATPNKIVPTTQTGEGGAGKQIYDRIGDRGQGETVVSREEQPVDIKASAGGPRPVASALTSNGWPLPPGSPGAASGNVTTVPSAVAPSPPGTAAAEPKKVRTVTIRPDQALGAEPNRAVPPASRTGSTSADTGTATSAAPAVRTQPARPSTQVQAVPAGNAGPLSLSPQEEAEGRRAGPARTAALTPTAHALPAAASGGYVVQLSAQKSEGEASASFRAIQAKYPDVLGGQHMLIRKKEVAGKGTFYGAQVGPFAGRDGAIQVCEQLKSAGGTCIVQKN